MSSSCDSGRASLKHLSELTADSLQLLDDFTVRLSTNNKDKPAWKYRMSVVMWNEGSCCGSPSVQQLRRAAEEPNPRSSETLPGRQRPPGAPEGRKPRRAALPGDHDSDARRDLLLCVLALQSLDASEESVEEKKGVRAPSITWRTTLGSVQH